MSSTKVKKTSLILLLVLTSSFVSSWPLQNTKASTDGGFGTTVDLSSHDYKEGQVLVQFKRKSLNVDSASGKWSLRNFASRHELKNTEVLAPQNLTVMESQNGESTEDMIQRLRSDPQIEHVEPNYVRHFEAIPNDTSFTQEWGMNNTQQTVQGISGAADADIDAPEAWDKYTGGTNVVVAVLDTGVAYNHPDLSGNMWDGSGGCKDDLNVDIPGGCPNHGWDFVNNDNDPMDDHGHGTHVAGILGAEGNNARGVAGVNWTTKIMAVKVGDSTGVLISDWIKGLNFAKNNGAKVVNASFGGPDFSQIEEDTISSFNGLFIAAAGNSTNNNDTSHFYPSDYPEANIISVAATDQNDNLASFSNYGATSVDVGAPGVNIYSTFPVYNTVFSENFESLTPPDIGTKFTAGGNTTSNWGTFQVGTKVLYADVNHIPYANNADTYVTSNAMDLSAKSGATLSYDVSCDTDNTNTPTDYLYVAASKDGTNFTTISRYYGHGSGSFSDDLFAYLGSQTQFRFGWITDGSNVVVKNYDGCHVDNVEVVAYDPTGENYEYLSGTSMAAPHVTGEAALIWSYDPTLSAANVKDIILNSGDSKAGLSGKTVTGKRINLNNALSTLAPVGGYSSANVIPANQITQSSNGDGVMTINFRLKDGLAGFPLTLKSFQYSTDGGSTFNAPTNGDSSLALSANWNNNSYVSAADFTGTTYNFTFNTKHADVTGLNGIDQNDVMVRFKVNDGAVDSAFATSNAFIVNDGLPAAQLSNTPNDPGGTSTDITVGGTNVTSYQYRLDSGTPTSFVPTSTHLQLSGLAAGPHVLEVFGKDDAGNVQQTATTFSWTVDTSVADVTGLADDSNPTKSKTWNWSSSDNAATFRFLVDQNVSGVPTGAYSSTKTTTKSSGNGTFYLHVQSKNILGNESSVTTVSALLDNTVPLITSVSATPDSGSAAVSWNTNEDASTLTLYGGTNSYGLSTTEKNLSPKVQIHSDTISGLTACTTYHYKVESHDAAGNLGAGVDKMFQTTGCQEVSGGSSPSVVPSGGGGGPSGPIITPIDTNLSNTQQTTNKTIQTTDTSSNTDYQNHWAKSYISQLFKSGVVNGCDAKGNFCPNNNISGVENLKIALRSAGIEVTKDLPVPADLSKKIKAQLATSWGRDYYLTGLQLGVIDKTYPVNDAVKRGQALQAILNAFMKSAATNTVKFIADFEAGKSLQTNPFKDLFKTLAYYYYVIFAYQKNIVQGYAEGDHRIFKGESTITRGEMAKIDSLVKNVFDAE